MSDSSRLDERDGNGAPTGRYGPLSERRRRSLSPGVINPRAGWSRDTPSWKPSRERLNKLQSIDLEQYRIDFRAGKYRGLTPSDRLEMFGALTMPVFVPLARGETMEMYAERFLEWLKRQHVTLEQLQNDPDRFRERNYRITFANANVNGDEKFVPPERKRERTESPSIVEHQHSPFSSSKKRSTEEKHTGGREDRELRSLRPKIDKHHEDARTRSEYSSTTSETTKSTATEATASLPSTIRICTFTPPVNADHKLDVMRAHLVCGCTKCLFATMDHMHQKITTMETATSTAAIVSECGAPY